MEVCNVCVCGVVCVCGCNVIIIIITSRKTLPLAIFFCVCRYLVMSSQMTRLHKCLSFSRSVFNSALLFVSLPAYGSPWCLSYPSICLLTHTKKTWPPTAAFCVVIRRWAQQQLMHTNALAPVSLFQLMPLPDASPDASAMAYSTSIFLSSSLCLSLMPHPMPQLWHIALLFASIPAYASPWCLTRCLSYGIFHFYLPPHIKVWPPAAFFCVIIQHWAQRWLMLSFNWLFHKFTRKTVHIYFLVYEIKKTEQPTIIPVMHWVPMPSFAMQCSELWAEFIDIQTYIRTYIIIIYMHTYTYIHTHIHTHTLHIHTYTYIHMANINNYYFISASLLLYVCYCVCFLQGVFDGLHASP